MHLRRHAGPGAAARNQLALWPGCTDKVLENMTNIYVGNLAYSVDDTALQALFEPHGEVQTAKVIMDRDAGRSRGFGFVEMVDDDEAQAAITALNGAESGGRRLTVNVARPRGDRPPRPSY